jgi:hypothetical protein
LDCLDRFGGTLAFPCHLGVWQRRKQLADAAADGRLVIDDENA